MSEEDFDDLSREEESLVAFLEDQCGADVSGGDENRLKHELGQTQSTLSMLKQCRILPCFTVDGIYRLPPCSRIGERRKKASLRS